MYHMYFYIHIYIFNVNRYMHKHSRGSVQDFHSSHFFSAKKNIRALDVELKSKFGVGQGCQLGEFGRAFRKMGSTIILKPWQEICNLKKTCITKLQGFPKNLLGTSCSFLDTYS